MAASRHQSTASTPKAPSRDGFAYPESLNIYRAGTASTLAVGFFRIVTLVVFAVGVVIYIPAVWLSPDMSSLWIPVVLVGSGIPLLFLMFSSSPMVHSIRVSLPQWARKSKDELKRFAANVPPDTQLTLEYMKVAPWPTKRGLHFSDLRRVRPNWKSGITNLECDKEAAEPHRGTIWFWLVQGYFGRYYVNRDQAKDRSAAPGLWDVMWQQIPQAGDAARSVEHEKTMSQRRAARMPVVMTGRPGREVQGLAPLPPKSRNRR